MTTIYFIERRLNKARLKYLKTLAVKSGLFNVCDCWQKASIVLAFESTKCEVIDFIKKEFKDSDKFEKSSSLSLVDLAWFHSCLKAKEIVDEKDYTLNNNTDAINEDSIPSKKPCINHLSDSKLVRYACETSAVIDHYNKKYCNALEILELHATYRGDKNSESRALAFRRGSAALKSYHKEVCNESDLDHIPFIGMKNSSKSGHCRKVIVEILSEGFSDEIESVINGDFFCTMKIFCGVFGVGPSTARKWYFDHHFRSLDDIKTSKINLTQDQIFGLQYYEDLNCPVTIDEANYVLKLVEKTCHEISELLSVTLAGGFRRGKTEGHDIDLLISKPQSVKSNIISELINKLSSFFLYTDKKMTSYSEVFDTKDQSSTMDRFNKCFSIFKFDNSWLKNCSGSKAWKAVRLDLVVVPDHQFAFALLGWTGTKHFEREIRRYARAEKQIVLTSHGMFKLDSKESINASSEKEIFEILGLVFRPPHERCF